MVHSTLRLSPFATSPTRAADSSATSSVWGRKPTKSRSPSPSRKNVEGLANMARSTQVPPPESNGSASTHETRQPPGMSGRPALMQMNSGDSQATMTQERYLAETSLGLTASLESRIGQAVTGSENLETLQFVNYPGPGGKGGGMRVGVMGRINGSQESVCDQVEKYGIVIGSSPRGRERILWESDDETQPSYVPSAVTTPASSLSNASSRATSIQNHAGAQTPYRPSGLVATASSLTIASGLASSIKTQKVQMAGGREAVTVDPRVNLIAMLEGNSIGVAKIALPGAWSEIETALLKGDADLFHDKLGTGNGSLRSYGAAMSAITKVREQESMIASVPSPELKKALADLYSFGEKVSSEAGPVYKGTAFKSADRPSKEQIDRWKAVMLEGMPLFEALRKQVEKQLERSRLVNGFLQENTEAAAGLFDKMGPPTLGWPNKWFKSGQLKSQLKMRGRLLDALSEGKPDELKALSSEANNPLRAASTGLSALAEIVNSSLGVADGPLKKHLQAALEYYKKASPYLLPLGDKSSVEQSRFFSEPGSSSVDSARKLIGMIDEGRQLTSVLLDAVQKENSRPKANKLRTYWTRLKPAAHSA